MLKKSYDMLSLSEKVKILELITYQGYQDLFVINHLSYLNYKLNFSIHVHV